MGGRRFGAEHDIASRGQTVFIPAREDAETTFDRVTRYGVPHGFGHREAEPAIVR